MAVKIKDVARAADVSIATVSYVLNNSAPVSSDTRERVLDAIRRLGYRPNSTARNLKASETRLIGYAWHNVQQGQMKPILDRFIYQMARAAESFGYHVLTFTLSPGDPAAAYDELIRTSRVDGFVVAETDYHGPIQRLTDLGFPFVVFGRTGPESDFLYADVDVYSGIRMAVEHLLALGHRRIGCIGWPKGSHNGDTRIAGYVHTLRAGEIEPRADWIVRVQNTIGDGFAGAKALLSLPEDERPTAIVSLSDIMATGALQYIEAVGLRAGFDVAITGFDDDPMSAFLRPPLTTLHQPIDEIAVRVAEMLVASIAGQPIPDQHVLFQPTLLIRPSSDPLGRTNVPRPEESGSFLSFAS